MAGEAGYYYTNLMGAAAFIEHVVRQLALAPRFLVNVLAWVQKPEQLHMSQDEFDHSMRGSIIGRPPRTEACCLSHVGVSAEATEGLESIRNLKSLLERMRNVENKQKVRLPSAAEGSIVLSCYLQVLQEEVGLLIDTLTALTASSVKVCVCFTSCLYLLSDYWFVAC